MYLPRWIIMESRRVPSPLMQSRQSNENTSGAIPVSSQKKETKTSACSQDLRPKGSNEWPEQKVINETCLTVFLAMAIIRSLKLNLRKNKSVQSLLTLKNTQHRYSLLYQITLGGFLTHELSSCSLNSHTHSTAMSSRTLL